MCLKKFIEFWLMLFYNGAISNNKVYVVLYEIAHVIKAIYIYLIYILVCGVYTFALLIPVLSVKFRIFLDFEIYQIVGITFILSYAWVNHMRHAYLYLAKKKQLKRQYILRRQALLKEASLYYPGLID